jgi:hypothetical protein
MSLDAPMFQVVIDCADPQRVARFWAELVHYELEHHDDMIRSLIAQGLVRDDETVEIDGALFFKSAVALSDPNGQRPRLLFQVVPEAKTVKNRLHLDIRIGDEHRDAEVERAKALGATFLWNGNEGPNRWVTMADPEGNEFCLS